MSTLATIIQHSFESPSHSNQIRKRKGIQTGKEVKLSLFADDMILYIEKPKDTMRKLLELINEIGKVAIYNRNLWHFYTLKDQKEKLKKQSHLALKQKE